MKKIDTFWLNMFLLSLMSLLTIAWLGSGILLNEGYFDSRFESMYSFLFTFSNENILLSLFEDMYAAGVMLSAKYLVFIYLIITVTFLVLDVIKLLFKKLNAV